MKKTYLMILITMLLLGCGDGGKGNFDNSSTGANTSEIQKAVESANEITPAPTWDSEYMQSIRYVETDKVVEFRIKNAHAPNRGVAEDELVKEGMWYIANFMTAFDYSIKGKKGEGDAELYKRIEKILDLLAEKEMGLRIQLECKKNRGEYTINLSPADVKKAIRMRKEDFFND